MPTYQEQLVDAFNREESVYILRETGNGSITKEPVKIVMIEEEQKPANNSKYSDTLYVVECQDGHTRRIRSERNLTI